MPPTKVSKKRGRPFGTPKTPGSGRTAGTPNKTTGLLKDAILKAASLAGNDLTNAKDDGGLVAYLRFQAKLNPTSFIPLLGKVLPMQIGGVSDEGEGINIQISFE